MNIEEDFHLANKKEVSNLMAEFLFDKENYFLETANFVKHKIINNELNLKLEKYQPTSKSRYGYGLYNLYEAKFEGKFLSFWLFVFGQGNATKPHNHRVNCASIVVSDEVIKESIYSYKDKKLFVEEEQFRPKGDISFDMSSGENIHSLSNPFKNDVITLHIYEMPSYKENGKFNRSVKKYF